MPAPADAPSPGPSGVLLRRVIFGAVLLAISCGLILVDWLTGRSFGIGAMVAYAMSFGMRELNRMLGAIGPALWPRRAEAAGVAVVAAQVAQHEVGALRGIGVDLGFAVIALYALLYLSAQLRHAPTRERLTSMALDMFGVLYILFLGSYVLRVRYLDDAFGGGVGHAAILYLVLAAKGTDMFAFFSGRFLGRRKLIPWISPGKTVAGAVGGLAGAVAITYGFVGWSDLGRVFGWSAALPFGIIIGLSATAGDLVESLVKRSTAVKDSGGLVPEFGGVLDIIDCILFVAPVIYYGAFLMRR